MFVTPPSFFGAPVFSGPCGPRRAPCRARVISPVLHSNVVFRAPQLPQGHPLDVFEADDGFYIKIDTPGLDASDIKVTMHEGVLTVAGKKKEESEDKDKAGRVLRRERTSSSFTRSFTVPKNVQSDKITATVSNGVLELVLPKVAPEPKPEPTNIPVATSSHGKHHAVEVAPDGHSNESADNSEEPAPAAEPGASAAAGSSDAPAAAAVAGEESARDGGAADWTEVTGQEDEAAKEADVRA